MTDVLKVEVGAPIRRLQVHRTPAAPGSADPRAVWLLQLRELAVQRVHRHERLIECLDRIRTTLGAIPAAIGGRLDEIAALATEIGLAVAAEIVDAALLRGGVDPTPVVRRCLEEATAGFGGAELVVRLHPEDLSLVVEELAAGGEGKLPDHVRLQPDAGVPRGGVRVDTEAGRLVYEPREVFERIAAALRQAIADDEAVPA